MARLQQAVGHGLTHKPGMQRKDPPSCETQEPAACSFENTHLKEPLSGCKGRGRHVPRGRSHAKRKAALKAGAPLSFLSPVSRAEK